MEKIKKSNWVNIILFFSLALNFFVAGYVVSDAKIFRNMHKMKMHMKRPEIRIVDFFPREQKREFHVMLRRQHEEIKPVQQEIFKKQQAILALIAASEIDEAQLKEAFAQYQQANVHLQNIFNEKLVKYITAMDYDTRQRILERGRKAHEKRMQMKGQMHKLMTDK